MKQTKKCHACKEYDVIPPRRYCCVECKIRGDKTNHFIRSLKKLNVS